MLQSSPIILVINRQGKCRLLQGDQKEITKSSQTTLSALFSLRNILEMDVIAEGVETERQWETLQELGCEYGQRFLFGKALPEAEIRDLIVSHQADLIIK